MSYDVEVLKTMIEVYNMNIKSFMQYSNTEDRIAEMVANRRLVAAMIENGGEPVVPPKFRNGNVFFDTMLYEANKPNTDTSWWTSGT
jgi:hypothetical protein